MPLFLGIDTSNYTTSLALYDPEQRTFSAAGKLLPVAKGALGLRQSDAVFAHVRQLPEVWSALEQGKQPLSGVGVSVAPRTEEGSYMPCFLVGKAAAVSVAETSHVPLHCFSHQQGHLAAAIRGSETETLFSQPFLAFHVSGGTTDLLLVEHRSLLQVTHLGGSADLKAGQLVDRVGKLLGLPFPAGPALEEAAKGSSRTDFRFKCAVDALECHLSGGYNLCEKCYRETGSKADTARFCLLFIAENLCRLTKNARAQYGAMPVLFAGGVMGNQLIRALLSAQLEELHFAPPAWSADNARGVALLAARAEGFV